MTKVGITGIGHSKFGKRKGLTIRELAHEATKQAFEDVGISPQDVDASVIGIAGEEFAGQGAPAAIIADYCGVAGKPTMRVETACATGTTAVRVAHSFIKAGLHDLVLVIGAEKMTSISSARATELMAHAGDKRWEYPFGVSFPAFYSLFASAHMATYGTTREQLSSVAVKNHHYGALNPYAHLPKEVPLEEAMKSVMVAEPLNLYDCCLISDGAAAVILANEEKTKELTDTPVWITGAGAASDRMLIAERKELTGLAGAKAAGKTAYGMAGVTPEDIDVACVHDCFTIAEIMAYEDLGFCEKGEGGAFIENQEPYIGGKIPINVDGGLKSKGHPIAATGVSQTVELTKQLRGEAEKGRQVDGANTALAHNVGQTGQFVNVLIFQR